MSNEIPHCSDIAPVDEQLPFHGGLATLPDKLPSYPEHIMSLRNELPVRDQLSLSEWSELHASLPNSSESVYRESSAFLEKSRTRADLWSRFSSRRNLPVVDSSPTTEIGPVQIAGSASSATAHRDLRGEERIASGSLEQAKRELQPERFLQGPVSQNSGSSSSAPAHRDLRGEERIASGSLEQVKREFQPEGFLHGPVSENSGSSSSASAHRDLRRGEGTEAGSLEQLKMELQDLLRGRPGATVRMAGLPRLYYNVFGKALQAPGYLAKSQRQGRLDRDNLTSLLACLNDVVTIIKRRNGQNEVVLTENAQRKMPTAECPQENAHTRTPTGDALRDVNPSSCKIFFTFPAESSFTEDDIEAHFKAYGNVQLVSIPYQPKRTYRYGFVCFVHSETVKSMLLDSCPKGILHHICGAPVLVRPYEDDLRKHNDRKYSERGEHIRYDQQSRSLDSKHSEYGNPGIPTYFDDEEPFTRPLQEDASYGQLLNSMGTVQLGRVNRESMEAAHAQTQAQFLAHTTVAAAEQADQARAQALQARAQAKFAEFEEDRQAQAGAQALQARAQAKFEEFEEDQQVQAGAQALQARAQAKFEQFEADQQAQAQRQAQAQAHAQQNLPSGVYSSESAKEYSPFACDNSFEYLLDGLDGDNGDEGDSTNESYGQSPPSGGNVNHNLPENPFY